MTSGLRRNSTDRVVLRRLTQPNEPPIQIEVNRVRWRDLPSLHRVRQQILLNQPYGSRHTGDPFIAGKRQLFPFRSAPDRVFVARSDQRVLGHCVFQVDELDDRWMLESVGANTGVYEAEPIWEELLTCAVVRAGLESAKRMYARLPTHSSVVNAARKVGFAPYTSEHIFGAPMVPVSTETSSFRMQVPSDVWSIHQLYMQVVPRQVQYAEALTSRHWESTRKHQVAGWLYESGNHVHAYVRVTTRPDRHMLEFLVHPEHRSVFGSLLRTVLSALQKPPSRPVFAIVRGYQAELMADLNQAGLTEWLEQDVLVKYTTVQNAAAVINGIPAAQELPEPVRKPVPSYFELPSETDGNAPPVRVFATRSRY